LFSVLDVTLQRISLSFSVFSRTNFPHSYRFPLNVTEFRSCLLCMGYITRGNILYLHHSFTWLPHPTTGVLINP